MAIPSFNLIEHYRNLSRYLSSQYQLSTACNHHGSKGLLRENILTDVLQSMSHDYVKLLKGEICDSSGRRTSEFDIVISHISSALRLFATPTNHVVPIETVLGIVEVKSILSSQDVDTFNIAVQNLNRLERYYITTSLYQQLGVITGNREYESFSDRPIKANEGHKGIGPVICGVFAFQAPELKSVREWFTDLNTEPNLTFICVLNKFIAYHNLKANLWDFSELGQDTFAGFASMFDELVKDVQEREVHLRVDSARYIRLAAQATQSGGSV